MSAAFLAGPFSELKELKNAKELEFEVRFGSLTSTGFANKLPFAILPSLEKFLLEHFKTMSVQILYDSYFNVATKGVKVRRRICKDTKEESETWQTKKKLKVVDFRVWPTAMPYDLRFAISQETDAPDFKTLCATLEPQLVRKMRRKSFQLGANVRIDLSEVYEGPSASTMSKSHVELEIDALISPSTCADLETASHRLLGFFFSQLSEKPLEKMLVFDSAATPAAAAKATLIDWLVLPALR